MLVAWLTVATVRHAQAASIDVWVLLVRTGLVLVIVWCRGHREGLSSGGLAALGCCNLVIVAASGNLEEALFIGDVTHEITFLKLVGLTRDSNCWKLNTTFTFKSLIWIITLKFIKWIATIWKLLKIGLTIQILVVSGGWGAVGARASTQFLGGCLEIVEILDKYFLVIISWFLSDTGKRYILFVLCCTRASWGLGCTFNCCRLALILHYCHDLLLHLLLVEVSRSLRVLGVWCGLLVWLLNCGGQTICRKLA